MKKIKLAILLIATIIITNISALATNVRGQIRYAGPYGYEPAQNITVVFYVVNQYNQLVQMSTASVTDRNGMYYFSNIIPQPYVVQVFYGDTLKYRFNILIPNIPQQNGIFFDIAPVLI